jgi:hypothetical protein
MAIDALAAAQRRLAAKEARRFSSPGYEENSLETEKAYRRGFDQGAAALAYSLGISDRLLQALPWKLAAKAFRWGRVKRAPWVQDDPKLRATRAQAVALVQHLQQQIDAGWFD